jgi:REP element-mobilizing transposase RayT
LERRYIFSDAADKKDFLRRLGDCPAASEAQCLAWAMMSNHYHLLIRAGSQPLSRLMGPLLGGFGGSYNRRHGRVGYVFQNCFKSILCEEDSYLLGVIRYIHLNPVRAKLVSNLQMLDHYPWTGHAGIVGKSRYSWHAADEVLRLFGETRRQARVAYRRFMQQGIDTPDTTHLSGGGLIRSHGGWESINRLRREHVQSIGDERILGSGRFVEQALADDELSLERKTLRQQQGWTLDALVDRVCKAYGVDARDLEQKARANNLSIAKSLICYWGTEELGLTMLEIGLMMGMSQQAISKWVKKGRDYCRSENIDIDSLLR